VGPDNLYLIDENIEETFKNIDMGNYIMDRTSDA
jgi:hypothetical protein